MSLRCLDWFSLGYSRISPRILQNDALNNPFTHRYFIYQITGLTYIYMLIVNEKNQSSAKPRCKALLCYFTMLQVLFYSLSSLKGDLSWSYWNCHYLLYPFGTENFPENVKQADPSWCQWTFRIPSTFQAGLPMQLLYWWCCCCCKPGAVGAAGIAAGPAGELCLHVPAVLCNACCKPSSTKELRKCPLADSKHK